MLRSLLNSLSFSAKKMFNPLFCVLKNKENIKMKVYAQEIEDGLQEVIESNTTGAYEVPILSKEENPNSIDSLLEDDKAIALSYMGTQAENKEQIDVY